MKLLTLVLLLFGMQGVDSQGYDSHGNCMDPPNGMFCTIPASDKPMDVPAIQEERTRTECITPGGADGTVYAIPCSDITVTEKVWTCADRTRILLTSEDGKKHCIFFGAK